MTIKFQILNAHLQSREWTLNHLQSLKEIAKKVQMDTNLLDALQSRFLQMYTTLSYMDLALIRLSLLNFFQDTQIKVGMLIKRQDQTADGGLIYHGSKRLHDYGLIQYLFFNLTKKKMGSVPEFGAFASV